MTKKSKKPLYIGYSAKFFRWHIFQKSRLFVDTTFIIPSPKIRFLYGMVIYCKVNQKIKTWRKLLRAFLSFLKNLEKCPYIPQSRITPEKPSYGLFLKTRKKLLYPSHHLDPYPHHLDYREGSLIKHFFICFYPLYFHEDTKFIPWDVIEIK